MITAYVAFCFLTYKDYGITWDEGVRYEVGKIFVTYYKTGKQIQAPDIETRQLPTVTTYFGIYVATLALLNPSGSYETYHLLNMLFALPMFIFAYLLLYAKAKKAFVSLAAPAALFLTPSLLGHISANPKDMPFAVSYFCTLILIYFFQQNDRHKFSKLSILALAIAFTQAQRLVGATLTITYFIYAIIYLQDRTKQKVMRVVCETAFIGLAAGAITVAIMPVLYTNFYAGLKSLIDDTAYFRYWNEKVLYFGQFLTRDQRPFTYLPVWLFMRLPLVILAPFLASPVIFKLKKTAHSIYNLMYIPLLLNFAIYLVLHPVIYNADRQFLYLYPPIVLVSVLFTIDLFWYLKSKTQQAMLVALVLIGVASAATALIALHPYEYVYFNEIVGGLQNAVGKFDTDYWGAAYKENTQWLITHVPTDRKINVYACSMEYSIDYYSKGKINLVSSVAQADYIMCDTDADTQRGYAEKYPVVVHQVIRQNAPLNTIRKPV
jgi:hypothetical protein